MVVVVAAIASRPALGWLVSCGKPLHVAESRRPTSYRTVGAVTMVRVGCSSELTNELRPAHHLPWTIHPSIHHVCIRTV